MANRSRTASGVKAGRVKDVPNILRELTESIQRSNAKSARAAVGKLSSTPGSLLHYRPKIRDKLRSEIEGIPEGEESSRQENIVDGDLPTDDVNLLHLATTHLDDLESKEVLKLLKEMIRICPKLLLIQRTGCYEGQTAVHVLVARGSTKAVKAVLCMLNCVARERILKIQAKGINFKGTVMMGELPLSIAALTFNQKMVSRLLKFKANIQGRNSMGDNIFHSLVKFSQCHEDNEAKVIEMMRFLHDKIMEKKESLQVGDVGTDKRSIWLMENNEGLTPLKLAAKLLKANIFNFIVDLDGVYSSLGDNDGLFDFLHYDTTEIDPVASRIARSIERRENNNNAVAQMTDVTEGACTREQVKAAPVKKVSVLEILYRSKTSDPKRLFSILDNCVVKEVIKRKWKKYRPFFFGWLFLHVIVMALFTWYVITKREIQVFNTTPPWNSRFVMAMSVIMFMWAVALVEWETVQIWNLGFCITCPYSVDTSRITLIVFASSVIVDSIWYWVSGPNGVYIAVVALTTGWWFCTFFLRPFKMFSFFTVMVHNVMFGDLLRFLGVLFLLYVAFTSAMYITFVSSPSGTPKEFLGFWNSSVTMFRLMLGLTEADVLNEAADPWLAVVLYVAYVLLAFVLILTSLFALMSDTASRVAEDRVGHWLMQMLGVVLCIEASLSQRFRYPVGRKKVWVRYDSVSHQRKDEDRYAIKIRKMKDRKKKSPLHDLLYSHAFQVMYGSMDHVVESSPVEKGTSNGFGADMLCKQERLPTAQDDKKGADNAKAPSETDQQDQRAGDSDRLTLTNIDANGEAVNMTAVEFQN